MAATLSLLTWKEARKDIKRVNPDLASAIDSLSPDDSYTLVKARYPFGQHILEGGKLHLPIDGDVVPLDSDKLDKRFRNLFGTRRTMPMGVVLNNSIELYLTVDKRVTPFSIMSPGKIFALWTALELEASAHVGQVWNITSGSRSLIMLPKISDRIGFNRLVKEFSLKSSMPTHISFQWHTFAELANHESVDQEWNAEVILFPAKWLENDSDPEWRLFRYHLMSRAWHDTAYLRNEVVFDYMYSCALADQGLKPNPYLKDIVKHLYSISARVYPGFVIAEGESAGPVSLLQKIFTEVYGLRYIPTMAQPGQYSAMDAMKPCYYSLQLPTLMEFSPKSKKSSSKLEDLREIIHLLEIINDYIRSDKLDLRDTPIYPLAKDIDYRFYHTEPLLGENIHHTGEIAEKDTALVQQIKAFPELAFCDTSPFLRGCISISSK